MSYYSTMKFCVFRTKLTQEEISKKWREWVNAKPEDVYIEEEDYEFEVYEDGTVDVIPFEGDFYAKHYGDAYLAEFIANVITPGSHTTLEFTGEDGENWGYFITHNSVKPIEYEKYVDGRPLTNVIKELVM